MEILVVHHHKDVKVNKDVSEEINKILFSFKKKICFVKRFTVEWTTKFCDFQRQFGRTNENQNIIKCLIY